MKKTIFMKNYSRNEIVLIKYPFSSLTIFKVRPAIIISTEHQSHDIIIVTLKRKKTLDWFLIFI